MEDYYIENLKRAFYAINKFCAKEFYKPYVTEFDITQLPKKQERPMLKIKSIKVFEEW